MRILLTLTLCCVGPFITTSYSQSKAFFEKYFKEELKICKVYGKVIHADLNCDSKNDYALILQNRKRHKDVKLYLVYSTRDSLIKQNLGSLGDTMDLTISTCPHCSPFYNDQIKYKCNGIFISSNDWNYLFEYDFKKGAFFKASEKEIGP
jgi:hypothetical protein